MISIVNFIFQEVDLLKGKPGPKPHDKEDEVPRIPEDVSNSDAEDAAPPANHNGTMADVAQILEEREPQPVMKYRCLAEGCGFNGTFEEHEEHSGTMSHFDFDSVPDVPVVVEPQQPALFETEAKTWRTLEIPVDEIYLDQTRKALALKVREMIAIKDEKKAFDQECNEKLKPIEESMRGLSKALEFPQKWQNIECEWRIAPDGSERILVRLDTGVTVDRKPLTAEDREAELAKAAEQNAEQPAVVTEEVPA